MTVTEPAPAKINLALHIRRKRPDGYHDLETLFAFAQDGDVVTVTPAARDSFTITGPFAALLLSAGDDSIERPVDNLVTQARDQFRATFGAPTVAISLEKNLPVASGIGGGSADAAATLRALARLTGTDLTDSGLQRIARSLGADVSACLLGQTAYATGRGDDLTPLPSLGDVPLLLINPRVPLSTATMFAAWDGVDRGPIAAGNHSVLVRAMMGRNDFTGAAIHIAPVVSQVLALLDDPERVALARLSGSGATCFGIFIDEPSRDSAAASARARGWWTLATVAR